MPPKKGGKSKVSKPDQDPPAPPPTPEPVLTPSSPKDVTPSRPGPASSKILSPSRPGPASSKKAPKRVDRDSSLRDSDDDDFVDDARSVAVSVSVTGRSPGTVSHPGKDRRLSRKRKLAIGPASAPGTSSGAKRGAKDVTVLDSDSDTDSGSDTTVVVDPSTMEPDEATLRYNFIVVFSE